VNPFAALGMVETMRRQPRSLAPGASYGRQATVEKYPIVPSREG
jgi:hypothetical protein